MHKSSARTTPSLISVRELHGMALLLVKRHGAAAEKMAAFLACEYGHYGDERRMEAWQAVQGVAHDMLEGRLGETAPLVN
jgi:hypothetical protein